MDIKCMKLGKNKNIYNFARKFLAMSKKWDNTVQLLMAVSEGPRRRNDVYSEMRVARMHHQKHKKSKNKNYKFF
jgi:hypothetical protein